MVSVFSKGFDRFCFNTFFSIFAEHFLVNVKFAESMDVKDFDPDGVGQDNGNYFGLPFTPEQSRLVLVSVPWDVTSSYGDGSRFAPDAIISASTQLDLYEPMNPGGWREGIGTAGIDYTIQERSTFLRPEAAKVMKTLEQGGNKIDDMLLRRRTERINEASEKLNSQVYEEVRGWLGDGKLVGLVGGDHSTPFGAIRAVAEKEAEIGVLHIDAHADLRDTYEGFVNSHASIMFNVMTKIPQVTKLVQVGLRDMSDGEVRFAASDDRIEQITDWQLAEERFAGADWNTQCGRVVEMLPEKVYVSFDIDGLSPDNCPHTGTPVPGGLSFSEAVWLLHKVVESGRMIVGFDLCEVSPSNDSEWDANVGARMLYKLCNAALKSTAGI